MKNNIIALLEISEETYYNMFLDFGIAYCKHYTAGDNFGSEMLQRSEHYWKWWQNQYYTIDKSFIKKYSNAVNVSELLTTYKRMHDAKFLDIYPSDYIISTAFSGIVYGKKQKQKVC